MNDSEKKTIASIARRVHALLNALHATHPENPTFVQVGFLEGHGIVVDFIANNEPGLALEHLLYMIHESEIEVPAEDIRALHALADKYAINHGYLIEDEQ